MISGPCNSFYCLGHFKNVYDDDDDDDDDDVDDDDDIALRLFYAAGFSGPLAARGAGARRAGPSAMILCVCGRVLPVTGRPRCSSGVRSILARPTSGLSASAFTSCSQAGCLSEAPRRTPGTLTVTPGTTQRTMGAPGTLRTPPATPGTPENPPPGTSETWWIEGTPPPGTRGTARRTLEGM